MSKKQSNKIKKLDFLIGKWHTAGEIFKTGYSPAMLVRGMDTYEWICNESFILHRVDVFMGNVRTEIFEIIGYDIEKKEYFMESFDNLGQKTIIYASLEKSGIMKLKAATMRAALKVNRKGNAMKALWEQHDGKNWVSWMEIKLTK